MPFLPISLDFSFLELIKAILLWRYKVLNQEVLGWCDNPCSPEFLWSCVSVPMVPVPVPFLWAFSVVTPLVWPLQCITGLINSMQGKKKYPACSFVFQIDINDKKKKKAPFKFSGSPCSAKHAWCFGFLAEFWHTVGILKKPEISSDMLNFPFLTISCLFTAALVCSVCSAALQNPIFHTIQHVSRNLCVFLPQQEGTWAAQLVVNRE